MYQMEAQNTLNSNQDKEDLEGNTNLRNPNQTVKPASSRKRMKILRFFNPQNEDSKVKEKRLVLNCLDEGASRNNS